MARPCAVRLADRIMICSPDLTPLPVPARKADLVKKIPGARGQHESHLRARSPTAWPRISSGSASRAPRRQKLLLANLPGFSQPILPTAERSVRAAQAFLHWDHPCSLLSRGRGAYPRDPPGRSTRAIPTASQSNRHPDPATRLANSRRTRRTTLLRPSPLTRTQASLRPRHRPKSPPSPESEERESRDNVNAEALRPASRHPPCAPTPPDQASELRTTVAGRQGTAPASSNSPARAPEEQLKQSCSEPRSLRQSPAPPPAKPTIASRVECS